MNGSMAELSQSISPSRHTAGAFPRPNEAQAIPDVCRGCRLEGYASRSERQNEISDRGDFVWVRNMGLRSRILQGYCTACKKLNGLTGLRLSDVFLSCMAAFAFGVTVVTVLFWLVPVEPHNVTTVIGMR